MTERTIIGVFVHILNVALTVSIVRGYLMGHRSSRLALLSTPSAGDKPQGTKQLKKNRNKHIPGCITFPLPITYPRVFLTGMVTERGKVKHPPFRPCAYGSRPGSLSLGHVSRTRRPNSRAGRTASAGSCRDLVTFKLCFAKRILRLASHSGSSSRCNKSGT